MTLRSGALESLCGWSAPSPDQAALRAEYLDFLQANPDGMDRSCVPGHITASALVFRADLAAVLLTLHPKVGRWLQLGGHCEPDDVDLCAAALREATEESGIAALVLLPAPARLDRHTVRCRPDGEAVHYDVQYVAVAPEGAAAAISAESLDLAWWPVTDLPPDTDDSVRSLVRAGRLRVG